MKPVADHPDSVRVTQQARNLMILLYDDSAAVRILIHDRDSKFCGPFDEAFRAGGIKVIPHSVAGVAEHYDRARPQQRLDLSTPDSRGDPPERLARSG